jgi:uncharacterized protein YbjT (DUF2867 family)
MEEVIRRSSRTLIQVGEALGIRNLDPDSGLVFVTGGGGVIGHRVALRLLNAGYPHVRLGSMHVDKLADLNKLGAEIADFAWDRTDTYAHALAGVKSVLCTVPYQKDWDKYFPLFLNACKEAGVKHFVKLSFYHARILGDPMQEIPLVQAHGICDELLVKTFEPLVTNVMGGDVDVAVDFTHSNMSYTILYGSHYMSNPFVFQGKELRESGVPGTFYGASDNHGVNYVSPNDVAEVATRVLLDPRPHYNKEYTLTGPEAIVDQQVADLLSKHLKMPVMYVNQPMHEFMREIKFGGDAAWMVRDMAAMEKVKASGTEEAANFVSDDIEKLCERKPESFEDYLARVDMMTPVEMGAEPELKPLKPEMSCD